MLAHAASVTNTVVDRDAATLPSVQADSLQASRDVTTSSRDTLIQKNESSASLSGLSDLASDVSFSKDGSLPNVSSVASSRIDPSIVPSNAKSNFFNDNDLSSKGGAHKRQREEPEEDYRKPAARRARVGDKPTARQGNNGIVAIKDESDGIFCQPVVSNPDCCGICETCTAPFVCGKCPRCSVELSCVFSPCCLMPESTLRRHKRHAHSIKLQDAKLESQFEKIYGQDGLITLKIHRNRKTTADKSIVTAKERSGRKLPRPCKTCSTCTDTKVCEKCQSCRGSRDGRCAFLPCLAFDYNQSTLDRMKRDANSAKIGVKRLEDKFEELYGDDGVFTNRLTKVDGSRQTELQRKEQLAGSYCGICVSCVDPFECGKCLPCRGHHDGRCVFALCPAFNDTKTKLAKSKQQAKSMKIGNQCLERRFDELYGPKGLLESKINWNRNDRNAKKLKTRCGACALCTTAFRCKECLPCRGKRDGACVFCPCLEYEYKESTLNSYREQAKSVKAGLTNLEDQFERIYGDEGLIVQKGTRANTSSASKVPDVANVSSQSNKLKCGKCSSCCSPIECGLCVRCCKKVTKCVFNLCQNFAYKDTRKVMYEGWARLAVEQCKDKKLKKHLKVRFDEIFGMNKTKDYEAANVPPRSGSYSCSKCSSCRSPISCGVCVRCKAKRRCVFDICQGYAYLASRMVIYETWAREALEVCEDNRLKVRFDELFTKGPSKTAQMKQGATSRVPNGTRVYARWHENNQWYYGNIIAQKHSLFDIEFDDGDKRKGVPRDEFKVCKPGEGMVTDLTVLHEHDACTAIGDGHDIGHFLLNKGYYHQWINRDGHVKSAFGKIESCSLIDGELKFRVALDLSVGHLLAFGVRNEAPKSLLCHVEEADTWSGYISFVAHTEGKKFTWSDWSKYFPLEGQPFYRHYTLPTAHAPLQQKSTELIVKGHRLQLKAKESKIPNGGLGLFVSAAPISSLDSFGQSRKKALVLEEGELIDLGVYAPLRPEDLQSEHVSIVKNFIHSWKSEKWSFASNGDESLVFDITDDATGDLNNLAENNILVFTNETNGKEVPNVYTREDPEGAVHYYLGHSACGNGRLLIPTDGSELELKVDYGRKYESVRVRNGYSRLSGKQLQVEKENASTYEKEMLDELNTLTAEEVFDTHLFLEKLNSNWTEAATDNDAGANGRALLVTLVLFRRAMVIVNEERNDSVHLDLVRSLRDLSLQFFDRFNFATNRSLILDNEWYAELLSTTLGLRVIKSIGDNTHSIRKAIQNLT